MRKLANALATTTLALGLAACHNGTYRIEGTAESLADGDTVVLAVGLWPTVKVDTTVVAEGEFVFEGEADSVVFAVVSSPNHADIDMGFFIEEGNIRLKLSDMPAQASASGTPNNRRWQSFIDKTLPIGMAIDSIARTMTHGTMGHTEQRHAMDELRGLEAEYAMKVAEHIEKNIDNEFGAFLLEHCAELLAPQERLRLHSMMEKKGIGER